MQIARRSLIVSSLLNLPISGALSRASLLDHAEWAKFKARFGSVDGRIIDNVNGGVSHSEGQGWGMLFAVAFDDPDSFDRIYTWTKRTLRRPTDPLHAWRF